MQLQVFYDKSNIISVFDDWFYVTGNPDSAVFWRGTIFKNMLFLGHRGFVFCTVLWIWITNSLKFHFKMELAVKDEETKQIQKLATVQQKGLCDNMGPAKSTVWRKDEQHLVELHLLRSGTLHNQLVVFVSAERLPFLLRLSTFSYALLHLNSLQLQRESSLQVKRKVAVCCEFCSAVATFWPNLFYIVVKNFSVKGCAMMCVNGVFTMMWPQSVSA